MASQDILDIVDNPVCIIGNGNKHRVVEAALGDSHCELEMLMGKISLKKDICDLPVRNFSGRTRAYLRIQDGCNNFCSYCIVPYTRGRSRSLPLAEILRQTALFAEEGYLELVITGINVGKYGLDLNEGITIYSLLARLCSNFPNIRIRLSSIEPTEVNDTLLDLMTQADNFMPHLHIPLQSGDNKVLALMNRRYSAEYFADIIHKCHQTLPHAAIGIDILGGFPGETEQAHENTVQLISSLPVTYFHVFPYSKRPGTLAASMKNQLSKIVKDVRVKTLRRLDHQKRQEFFQKNIGSNFRVLVERRNKKNGLLQGFSENYIPIQFQGSGNMIKKIISVRFEKIENEQPFGIVIEN
jgi:threonylcarbamoyladenosine tRNA methylthiotransferase MtaB